MVIHSAIRHSLPSDGTPTTTRSYPSVLSEAVFDPAVEQLIC
jgi:hypothetical protein